MSGQPVRIFSIDEARRALPLVERIVRDLVAAHRSWREAVQAIDAEVAAGRAGVGGGELVAAAQACAGAVERCLEELRQIGCIVKGLEDGLVDFYALRDDRLVFLCWRLGEPTIAFWHDVEGGFAGRQPLDADLFTGTVS